MPMRRRHSQPAGCFLLEIELDDNGGLVAYNPPIMPGLYRNHLRGCKLETASVRVLDMDLALGKEADMGVHTKIGTDDGLHVDRPTESGRIDHTFHTASAGANDIEFDTGDLSMLRIRDAIEERVFCSHSHEF
jgi:hypothetical protein